MAWVLVGIYSREAPLPYKITHADIHPAPWRVMGGGLFKTTKELEERGDSTRGGGQPNEEQKEVCKALEEVAEEVGKGTHLTHSELSSHLHRTGISLRLAALMTSLTLSRDGVGEADVPVLYPYYWRYQRRAPQNQYRGGCNQSLTA